MLGMMEKRLPSDVLYKPDASNLLERSVSYIEKTPRGVLVGPRGTAEAQGIYAARYCAFVVGEDTKRDSPRMQACFHR